MIRYDYFNLSDKQFFRDHEPIIYESPKCIDSDHFYYKTKKLSFTKTNDVSNRALQAIRKGKPLIFHWRGSYLTREVLSELLTLLGQTARQKEKHTKISLNWSQAVLYVTFTDKVSEEEFIVEDADRGEHSPITN